jgi:hypothetical protein
MTVGSTAHVYPASLGGIRRCRALMVFRASDPNCNPVLAGTQTVSGFSDAGSTDLSSISYFAIVTPRRLIGASAC